MKRFAVIVLLALIFVTPAHASEISPPAPPDEAQIYMPDEPQTFGEGLMYVLSVAIAKIQPEFVESAGICASVIGAALMCALLIQFEGQSKKAVELASIVIISILLIRPTHALIGLGRETIVSLSNYGKLLIPILTAALASQGAVTTSSALYAGTSLFGSVLNSLISNLIVPMLYIYLCMSITNHAINDQVLKQFRDFVKWLMTWSLKIVIYIFTGYMTITGVVSGTADATAIKATKLAISSMIPVVGGLLSDASETILVSTGLIKNSVGVYGLLAIISVVIGPFIKIATQYLLLKLTVAVTGVFASKRMNGLLNDISGAMGMVLAMIGVQSLLLIISTVCFIRGAG